MPLDAGQEVLHYRLIEKIGEGGMGQVYRAVDLRLGRDVALKVLPLEAAAQPDRLNRFEREARSLAALSHPNIVTIHSVEEAEGVRFLTMELVRGRTLDKATPERGLPLDRFLELAITLADALGSAHRKGITHRDLKPTNIMIDEDGRLKILDFGLVKLLEPENPDEMATRTIARENTLEGRIVGTVAYMSPEQAEAKPLDHRSDLFSLGVVLYEMLTGRRPFEGGTQMSTLSAIIREEPVSVTDLRKRLPRHLGRIIRRCLQKDVERRYQSALDLRNDLQELRDEIDSGVLEPPPGALSRASGSRWVLPAAGIAVIAGLAYVAVRLVGSSDGAPALSRAAAPVQVPVTTSGKVTSGSVSPDGHYVTFVAEAMGRSSLYVKQLATGSEVEIVPPGEASIGFPTVSPDGQYVFYQVQPVGSSNQALYRTPLLGGTPNQVVEGVTGGFAFSPDGARVAFFRPGKDGHHVVLCVARSDGTAERELTTINASQWPQKVAWSPTGDHLLSTEFVSDSEREEGHGFVLIEVDVVDGTVLRKGSRRWTGLSGVRWRNDGRIFLAGIRGRERYHDPDQLWRQDSFDTEPRLLLSDLASYLGVSLDGSGTLLASVAETFDQAIWVLNETSGGGGRRIDYTSRIGRWYVQVAWTPDSRLLVEHREGDDLHIRALSSQGGQPALLTTAGPFNMGPTVAPAGDRFAFFSNRSGAMKIWVADISGAHARRLTGDDWEEFFPEFGPRGEWVYYHTHGDAGWRLRRAPVDGGPSELLTDEPALLPKVSPDGQRLLAWKDDGLGPPKPALIAIDGGDLEPLELDFFESGGDVVTWYPDGAALTCDRWDGSEASIWVVPLDNSEPRKLASFSHGEVRSLAWNATGDSLAVVTSRRSGDVVLVKGL